MYKGIRVRQLPLCQLQCLHHVQVILESQKPRIRIPGRRPSNNIQKKRSERRYATRVLFIKLRCKSNIVHLSFEGRAAAIYGRRKSLFTFTKAAAPPLLAAVSSSMTSVTAHSFSSAAEEGLPKETNTEQTLSAHMSSS